jgi:uncharacterized membrane protein
MVNTVMFLGLRVTHVLFAAVWIGSTGYHLLLLTPAIAESGSAGGQVMLRLGNRLGAYMATLSIVTTLSGVYLLWRFTGGFDPAVSATHAGVAFGVGGVAGILAGVIGGAVVGRNAGQMMQIMTESVGVADGAAKAALMQRAATCRQRMNGGTRAVFVLQATALVLMTLGHYV